MIKSFFEDKFEYDFRCNQQWIQVLEENEDHLNNFLKRSISHILNVHHIWICRLIGVKPDSEEYDILPISHWEQFAQQNYLQTIEFIKDLDEGDTTDYHTEEGKPVSKDVVDVLYHILNHSAHHRGQISKELRDQGIEPPSFNFIAFH